MGIAKEHLTPSRIEDIARGLLTVKSITGGTNLIALCPWHDEKTPSYTFDYEKDLGGCFVCRDSSNGDIIHLWSYINGHNKEDGFIAFCKEFGIDSDYKDDTNACARSKSPEVGHSRKPNNDNKMESFIREEVVANLPSLPDSTIKKLKETRCWSPEIIDLLQIKTYVDQKKNKRIAIPIYDGFGRLGNIRIYSPGAEQFKMISWSEGKGKDKITYGTSRLFPPPPLWTDGPIWLIEGEPDVICGLSQGMNVVTQTGGCGTWKLEFSKALKGRDIILCYDADKAGLAGMEKVYKSLLKFANSIKIFKWPELMFNNSKPKYKEGKGPADYSEFVIKHGEQYPADHGDDLTDWFVKHGKSVVNLEGLLFNALNMEKSKPPGKDEEFFGGNRGGRFYPSKVRDALLANRDIISDPLTGLIYEWDGRHYKAISFDSIESIVDDMLKDESEPSRTANVARLAYLRSLISRKDMINGKERQVNDHYNLIALNNTMLDINTMAPVPHSPYYLTTQILDYNYDPLAKCVEWMKFIEEVVPDITARVRLQQFFGYCLTRETRFAKALILKGPGSDGKSIILKLLEAMIGQHNCCAVRLSDLDDQFQRATLYGKLLNVATEQDKNYSGSSMFKSIVTGDLITAAYKHKDFFQFRPYCKLAFASNFFPQVNDFTHGFYRRWIGIEFTKQFEGADDNKHLEDQLLKELPGIFLWALAGLDQLKENDGFVDSKHGDEFMEQYKLHNNPVLAFVEDRCEVDSENDKMREPSIGLYEAYAKYCTKNGYSSLSNINFGEQIIQLLRIKKGKTLGSNRVNAYIGISLEQ